jgi:hypothetical protein
MWFGKMATPRDRGRQALLLWGGGKTGNTVIAKAVEEYFEGVACTEPEGGGGKFTIKESAGYLVSMMNDVSNYKYLFSDDFKRRTGGDTQRGEVKFGKGIDVDYFVKLLVTTNHALKIDPMSVWSTSRVLPVRMSQIKESDRCSSQEEIVEKLKAELPAFIHSCRMLYAYSGFSGDIPITMTTSEVMYDMELSVEREMADWVVRNLEPSNDMIEVQGDNGDGFYTVPVHITEKSIRDKVRAEKIKLGEQNVRYDDFKISNITTFIGSVYGVTKETIWITTSTGKTIAVNGFFGIKVLEEPKNVSRISSFVPSIPDTFGLNLRRVHRGPVPPPPVVIKTLATLEDLL